MGNNYFVIERKDQCWENVDFSKYAAMTNKRIDYLKNATFDEMKRRYWLSNFVLDVMECANELSGTDDDYTVVNLLGEDGVFIWGILIGPDNGKIRYSLIDWKKNGKNYRYEN
jgi:hypothetical protein